MLKTVEESSHKGNVYLQDDNTHEGAHHEVVLLVAFASFCLCKIHTHTRTLFATPDGRPSYKNMFSGITTAAFSLPQNSCKEHGWAFSVVIVVASNESLVTGAGAGRHWSTAALRVSEFPPLSLIG